MSGTPGTLVSLELVNFMKHKHLLIDLKPHVNFITGRNGSGKSSILVALSIALGGSSRTTNRGTKLSDLIRESASKASVTLSIRNGGDGYAFERYGEMIVFTRTISSSSTSLEIQNFPKSSAQQTKEELSKILAFFNIQYDNVCSIMHQDVAREFIGTSKPTKKYELFMQGTLITKLTSEVAEIKQNIAQIKIEQKRKTEEKQRLDNQLEKAQAEVDLLKVSDRLENSIASFENELAWAHANASLEDAEKARVLYEDAQNKFNECTERLAISEEKLRQSQDKLKEIEIGDSMSSLNSFSAAKNEAAVKLSRIQGDISSCKSTLTRMENSLANSRRELQKEENKKSERMKRNEEASRQQKLEQANKIEERGRLEQLKNDNYERIEQYSKELQKIESDTYNLQNDRQTVTQKLNDAKKKFNALRTETFSTHGFKYPVIGPISDYVKLRDNRWGPAAQVILGKVLDMYLVGCQEDERLLRTRKNDSQLTIMATNFTLKRYNIPSSSSFPNATRLIDLLSFRKENISGLNFDDIVFNAVVDLVNADRVWCFEHEDEAKRAAYAREVQIGLTITGVQYRMQNNYEMRRGAKLKSCRIGAEFKGNRLSEVKAEVDSLSEELNSIVSTLDSFRRKLDGFKNEKHSLEKQNFEIIRKMAALDSELQANNYADEGLDEFTIDRIKKDIREIEAKIPAEKEKMETLKAEKEAIKRELEEISESIKSSEGALRERDERSRVVRSCQKDVERVQREKDGVARTLDGLRLKHSELVKKANQDIEKARQICPEREEEFSGIGKTRTVKVLTSLLIEEKRKLEKQKEASGLDPDVVRQNFERVSREHQKASRYLSELQDFLETCDESLRVRETKLISMRDSITRRTKVAFLNYQKQRKYNGQLVFNHVSREINILVKSKADSEFTDVSALSGGEKSYCLVSLLLSLWEVMEAPFYCVDEFDVYMDDVNRQAATTLLIQGAASMDNRQFIFITPLNLDHLRVDDRVSVFEVTAQDD